MNTDSFTYILYFTLLKTRKYRVKKGHKILVKNTLDLQNQNETRGL